MLPPLAFQVSVGCAESGLWNWSSTLAVNCCLAPAAMVAVPGVTLMLVAVWATVTETAAETLVLPAATTFRLYARAAAKVTVVFAPLVEKPGAVAPLGAVAVDH